MSNWPFDDELDERSGGRGDEEGRDLDDTAGELEDRLGWVRTHEDGAELVLTRVSRYGGAPPLEMLRFDREHHLLRIFPRATRNGRLEPQFEQVTELQLEDFNWDADEHSAEHDRFGLLYVRGLPKGFGSIYEFGLGIQREYADLIDEIEKYTESTIVRFADSDSEGEDPDGRTFRLSLRRFEDYRAAVNLNRGRGHTAVRRVVDAECHNAVAVLFGMDLVQPKYGRNAVIRALTEEVATGHVMNPEDRDVLASELARAAPALAREAPERLGQLRADIELVSLEALIERFATSLAGKHATDEPYWQDFFNANRFALAQVFSTPLVVLREHAHVQAADVDGRGARITDFLCANTVTRTVVVVEIKTPAAKLVTNRPYRGRAGSAAVYPPHVHLSGAVSQVQSQLTAIPQDLARRLDRTPELDIDAWHDPRGAVIAGRLSSLDGARRESFLRYRAGLSGVTVLGYDEILEQLIALHRMLQAAPHDD